MSARRPSIVLAAAVVLLSSGCTPVATAPAATLAQTASPAPTASPAFSATADTAAVRAAEPSATMGAGGAIPSGLRIAVPRLGIDLPIAEGDLERDVTDLRTPEGYAFHLPGTSLPGQNGNTYLYAHARRGMFLALWDVRLGDGVVVTGPGSRRLAYVVDQVLPRVPPSDVSSTLQTASERLTLQTSTGPSPSDPRYVVVCVPVRAAIVPAAPPRARPR